MTTARNLSGPRLIAAMCLCEILCMAGFATYPALLPRLSLEWGLSNTAAGLIGGILFFAYALGVPFLAGLTDRVDARRVYMASCIVASTGSGLFGLLADGLVSALAFQALFGIGFAGVFMPGLKALSDRIEPALQSRAVALYTALSSIGLGASFALSGWIAEQVGWRVSFYAAAAGPLLACLIVAVGLDAREPPAAAQVLGLLQRFRLVLRNRPAMGYITGYVAHCWELYGVRAWIVAFFVFVTSRTPDASAALPATIVAVISLVGMVSSIMCNELAARFRRARLITIMMLAGVPMAVLLGLVGSQALWLAAVVGALHYGLVMGDSALLNAGTVAAAVPEQRGATMALHSTLGFGAGLLSPIAFGLALDLFGRASIWGWTLGFIVLALPGLPASWALQRMARPSDDRVLAVVPDASDAEL